MVKLDDEIRVFMEKNIDALLKDPEAGEVGFTSNLLALGIKPNLERLLSHLTGYLFGLAQSFYSEKYRRDMTLEEIIQLRKLLKKRAIELREAFMSTRIES